MARLGIRYIDRLLILPLLTRISGGPPSRFIHQIVLTLLSIFVIAGYCSWAFGIELGSLVARCSTGLSNQGSKPCCVSSVITRVPPPSGSRSQPW